MQEATTHTKQTIAVLSDDYFTSLFAQPEWADAFGRDPRGEKRTLIPVRVRECQPPGFFSTIIYIDLVDTESDVARLRLLDGIAPGRARLKPAAFPGNPSSVSGATRGSDGSSTGSQAVPFPKNLPPVAKSVEIFTIFAPKDEEFLQPIEDNLAILKRQALISTWSSNKIIPGLEIEKEIEKYWQPAKVILVLVSANLYANEKAFQLYQRAIARHRDGSARVVPIIARACINDLDQTFSLLPQKGKPITSWSDRSEAYNSIAVGINEVVQDVLFSSR